MCRMQIQVISNCTDCSLCTWNNYSENVYFQPLDIPSIRQYAILRYVSPQESGHSSYFSQQNRKKYFFIMYCKTINKYHIQVCNNPHRDKISTVQDIQCMYTIIPEQKLLVRCLLAGAGRAGPSSNMAAVVPPAGRQRDLAAPGSHSCSPTGQLAGESENTLIIIFSQHISVCQEKKT